MKKNLIFVLALAGSLCVLSCSKEKEQQENMSVAKQQALIEQSIIDFTNMVQASDFEEMAAYLKEMVEIAKNVDMNVPFRMAASSRMA